MKCKYLLNMCFNKRIWNVGHSSKCATSIQLPLSSYVTTLGMSERPILEIFALQIERPKKEQPCCEGGEAT